MQYDISFFPKKIFSTRVLVLQIIVTHHAVTKEKPGNDLFDYLVTRSPSSKKKKKEKKPHSARQIDLLPKLMACGKCRTWCAHRFGCFWVLILSQPLRELATRVGGGGRGSIDCGN